MGISVDNALGAAPLVHYLQISPPRALISIHYSLNNGPMEAQVGKVSGGVLHAPTFVGLYNMSQIMLLNSMDNLLG